MDKKTKNWQPQILELVGPAGSGKTSIAFIFQQQDNRVTFVNPPNIRNIRDLPLYLYAVIYSLPIIFQILITKKRGQDRISWKQATWLILLNWYRISLKRFLTKNNRIFIIDQGPVYLLSVLYKFGPQNFTEQQFNYWWKKVFTDFADKLKMIIWLDAPNKTLLQRINNRETWHNIKGKSEKNSFIFLTNTREALEQAINLLCNKIVKPEVVRYNTSCISQMEIVKKTLHHLG